MNNDCSNQLIINKYTCRIEYKRIENRKDSLGYLFAFAYF